MGYFLNAQSYLHILSHCFKTLEGREYYPPYIVDCSSDGERVA